MRSASIRIDDLDRADGEQDGIVHLKDEQLLAVAGGLVPTGIRVNSTPFVTTASSNGAREYSFDPHQN